MLLQDGLFTSEAVSPGHPDKICDQVSDAILDACLAQDPNARVAIEAAIKGNLICLLGEITSSATVNLPEIARQVLRGLGHDRGVWGLDPDRMRVVEAVSQQACEIAAGVGGSDIGAGDQGLMFGFASAETDVFMPLPLMLARGLIHRVEELRRGRDARLGLDFKAQTTLCYQAGKPIRLEAVVLSCQHAQDFPLGALRAFLFDEVLVPVLGEWLTDDTELHLNPAGSFHMGGPVADAGLTGRKIIADTYGGMARHGGGAFSGKDATKVDRSGAYAARQLARDVVARGWAHACEVRVAYAIGRARPVAVDFDCFGTEVGQGPAQRYAALGVDLADALRPTAIIERLDLRRPIFRDTAAHAHFGRPDLPWEKPFLAAGIGEELDDPPTAEQKADLEMLRDMLARSALGDLGYPSGLALTALIARYPLTARKLREGRAHAKEFHP